MRSVHDKPSRSQPPDALRSIRRAAAGIALLFCFSSPVLAADLVMQFGGTGSGDGEFLEINGIDVDDAGRIYVIDAGNTRVQVFGPDGTFLYTFGTAGVGPGEFDIGVCGLTVDDRRDRIYVSEGIPGTLNHRIQLFDLDGTFRFEFGTQGSGVPAVGTTAAEFESPCQMAVDQDSNLYVVDSGNDRVQVFDSLQGFLHAFGSSGAGDGQFTLPSGIAIDRSGKVFVADSFAARIQVFDFDGVFLSLFGAFGTGDGEFDRPCHLAQGGLLYVADALNERVQVFDLESNFQLQFPISGTVQSIFCSNVPTGLATDRLGRIYVEEGNFVSVYSIDRDGDGLLDLWETAGIDTDGDGVVDFPLHEPPYNADPNHKDLYLEFDWDAETPMEVHVVRQMKQTLCAAPVNAGGVPNPDGEPGIRLHVDTGNLIDPRGTESPQIPCSCGDGLDNNGDGVFDAGDPSCFDLDPAGGEGGAGLVTCGDGLDNDGDGAVDEADTDCPLIYDEFAIERTPGASQCDDGVDNDGDGAIDGDDPDCLVGDDLGGGTMLLDPSGAPFSGAICDLDADFYAAKGDNFDPARAMVFRYAIQAPRCDTDGDGEPDSRSKAEVGGNDTLISTVPASALPPGAFISPAIHVHELGHTLRLFHGGDDNTNCEPNYVSLMNYNHSFGLKKVLRTVRAGTFDFSPPRFPGGRGTAPLPAGSGELDESALDERTVLDPTDRLHLFSFVNALGEKVRSPLNGDVDGDGVADGVDWNGDGVVSDLSGFAVNVDTSGLTGRPPECTNSSFDVLTGYHDWFNISLPFRQFGDLADAPLNPTLDPEPTLEELQEQEVAFNTTDLAVQMSADADPVEVGTDLSYTIAADNHGPNPAGRVRVESDLPIGSEIVSQHSTCAVEASERIGCEFGPLPAGAGAELGVRVSTDHACSEGIPQLLEAAATIQNVAEFAGDDPSPADNAIVLLVDTVDTTAPVLACNAPATITPREAPQAYTATGEDLCDSSLEPEITAVECYLVNRAGRRIEVPCRTTVEGATLEIKRTGGVGTRIEWTVEVTDGAGNHSEEQCLIQVVRP